MSLLCWPPTSGQWEGVHPSDGGSGRDSGCYAPHPLHPTLRTLQQEVEGMHRTGVEGEGLDLGGEKEMTLN